MVNTATINPNFVYALMGLELVVSRKARNLSVGKKNISIY